MIFSAELNILKQPTKWKKKYNDAPQFRAMVLLKSSLLNLSSKLLATNFLQKYDPSIQ